MTELMTALCVQIAYVAKLAKFMASFSYSDYYKSDMHNCLNCRLFCVFNYVKSMKSVNMLLLL